MNPAYHPDCYQCRKEAGKPPAGVSETHLCLSHLHVKIADLEAEVLRLSGLAYKYNDERIAAEARYAQLLDAAHRLEERCVAAEEERNRERRHRKWLIVAARNSERLRQMWEKEVRQAPQEVSREA